MAVLVVDKRKNPLMPCSEKRARLLLERGRAVVHKMRPFTIRLKDRTAEASTLQPVRIKIDPGSRATGVAVIREDVSDPEQQQVLMLMEVEHRGHQIKGALAQVPSGKKAGTYQGRVAIRATGNFNIQTAQGVVQGISYRHCRLLQRADGYGYTFQPKPLQEDAIRAA